MRIQTQVNKTIKAETELRDLFALTSHCKVDNITLQSDALKIAARHFPNGPENRRTYLQGYAEALMRNNAIYGRAYPQNI